jgi:hypothetical protein
LGSVGEDDIGGGMGGVKAKLTETIKEYHSFLTIVIINKGLELLP